MNIEDVVALVPEANREAVKNELSAMVKIDSKETALKLAWEHPHLKSVFDAEKSRVTAENEARIMKEKFPAAVKAEVERITGPEKDPLKLRIAELEAKEERRENELRREKLKALAVKLAADEGIPVDDIDRFIDADEDATASTVKAYAKRVKAWRDSQIEAELKKRFGNQEAPRGGKPAAPQSDNERYAKILATEGREAAIRFWDSRPKQE